MEGPETQEPAPEPASLNRIRRTLELVAPVIWPLIGITALIAFVGLAVFAYVANEHLIFSRTELNMSTTSEVAQFLSGTLGTAFTIISSLLLVVTLWIQIHEYGLTRIELRNSIREQQELTKASREQVAVMQLDQKRSEQEAKLDRISVLLRELKEDTLGIYSSLAQGRGPSLAVPISTAYISTYHAQCVREALDNDGNAFVTGSFWFVTEINLILQRARGLDTELQDDELPPLVRLVRRQELVMFVKRSINPQREYLFNMSQTIKELIPKKPSIKGYQDKMIALLDEIDEIMVYFTKIELMEI